MSMCQTSSSPPSGLHPPHPGYHLSSFMLQISSNTRLAWSSLFLKKRSFQQGIILKFNKTHHCCLISPHSITERLLFDAHPLVVLPTAILLALPTPSPDPLLPSFNTPIWSQAPQNLVYSTFQLGEDLNFA